jgi:hypothetical protein
MTPKQFETPSQASATTSAGNTPSAAKPQSSAESKSVSSSPANSLKAQSNDDASAGSSSGSFPILSGGEFNKLSEQVLAGLPKVSDLQKLKGEEAHHTPMIVSQAGIQVGRIAQAVHDNPALSEDGVQFYKKCATQGDGASSVRALCFAQLRNLETHLGRTVETDGVPESVQQLAQNIPVEEP